MTATLGQMLAWHRSLCRCAVTSEDKGAVVVVARVFQAHCEVPGCGWRGAVKKSYEDAGRGRIMHLEHHWQQQKNARSWRQPE